MLRPAPEFSSDLAQRHAQNNQRATGVKRLERRSRRSVSPYTGRRGGA